MALQDLKDKLAEYETAVTDREAKQEKHAADQAALQIAIDNEGVSRTEWLAALQHEHAVEDEFEALVVSHEPPALP